jgi:hypothetical protein
MEKIKINWKVEAAFFVLISLILGFIIIIYTSDKSSISIVLYDCIEDYCKLYLPYGNIFVHESLLEDSISNLKYDLHIETGNYYIFKKLH